MNWIVWVIPAIAGLTIVARKAGQVSEHEAHDLLHQGAVVVDVRTQQEFAQAHLPKAINLPLDAITTTLPRRFPDLNQPILLHCQMGPRAGVARNKLRAIGYSRVFNLGGYARARKIIAGAGRNTA